MDTSIIILAVVGIAAVFVILRVCKQGNREKRRQAAQQATLFEQMQSQQEQDMPKQEAAWTQKEENVAPLKQEKVESQSQSLFCPNCGEKVLPDSKFCINCGLKLG